jgi:alkylation response protein AidB-like acyl-CoA dehydrogenase
VDTRRWVHEQVAEVVGDDQPAERGWDELLAVSAELGRRRLLAPHWPSALGGLDTGLAESAHVVEQLVLAGYTDTLIVNGIYNVGHALLRHGAPGHHGLLRDLSAGRSFATVLFTESEAGSDIAGVRTRVRPSGEGWSLSGEKTWIAQADVCDYGICLARAAGEPGDVTGLRLLLVPLRAPGVTMSPLDTTWSEPLFTVAFDKVHLAGRALIGSPASTWELLTELLAMERVSPGYWARGARWRSRIEALGVEFDAQLNDELAVASALSDRAVATTDQVDPVRAAIAKYRGSVATVLVAQRAVSAGLPEGRGWLAEAGGLALAAGTSEMMLRKIAPRLPDLLDEPGRD